MRFVWKNTPAAGPYELRGTTGSPRESEAHSEIAEQQKDLQSFFEAQNNKNISDRQLKDFESRLTEWERSRNTEGIRTAGLDEPASRDNYLRRHALLSKSFLQSVEGSNLRFKLNFRGNQLAEWKVGLGDILPPNVTKIKMIRADGSEDIGIRTQDPVRKRIGYFKEAALAQGRYEYLAAHSGDQIEIKETRNIDKSGDRGTLKEHEEIYQRGAAKDSASEPEETQPSQFREVAAAYQGRRTSIMNESVEARAKTAPSSVPANPAKTPVSTPTNISPSNAEKAESLARPGSAIERATGKWRDMISQACAKHHQDNPRDPLVPVELVQAIMYNESRGNPNARGVNKNGTVDQGLMQLNNRYFNAVNIMDPAVNIATGVRIIAGHLKRSGGDLARSVEAYNCGHPGRIVEGKVIGIPPATEAYRNRVLASFSSLNSQNARSGQDTGQATA